MTVLIPMNKFLLAFNVNDHIFHTNYQNLMQLRFPGQSSPKTKLELYI